MDRKKDTLDKLVVFLAKRDGIDKLVKTFQYVGKLAHYKLAPTHPALADRYQKLEVAAGLSRKAFRTGRFLTGFNALRTTPFADRKLQWLSVLGYGGEMIYWLFDHFLWLSKVGVLDADVARRMGYISAFGEAFGYVWFVAADLIVIRRGMQAEVQLRIQVAELQKLDLMGVEVKGGAVSEQVKDLQRRISAIRMQRVMCAMSIIANVSDFVIAMAAIEPGNAFVSHPVTLGISGLASAWSGWYKNWPEL